ncbi:hypothetical protein A1O1_02295 [Capronia coronata CBS 617.96]|uniref:Tyrosyl-DNA phosphodiesterase 1 n=1 Tax=Capronia coronata CBS 617.96 TaxID=1182541 RepID=W9YLZ3_9EURO|nr:uncharacterized protein A1O1_02295 [Capronia coronata CBS 617.96]EXJ93902.1 hypothetical protein A1O1_02295 [Capronia coronata CBS 617.96]
MTSRPSKRLKLDGEQHGLSPTTQIDRAVAADPASIRTRRAAFLDSISRSISPPPVSRSGAATPQAGKQTTAPTVQETEAKDQPFSEASCRPFPSGREHAHPSSRGSTTLESTTLKSNSSPTFKSIPSPFKLTSIHDLPGSQNIDTFSLHDILGNPLIKEAWIFNFCFDVDWLMDHFDADTRAQVKVKIVHGSWRAEDANRLGIEDACRRWPNVEAVTAYLPDPFGTHHSKMFILFTHDDLAQVVIHTANMLHKDWSNMTQAVWQSPMLPRKMPIAPVAGKPHTDGTTIGRIGTGSRFKHDLTAYLAAYGSKTKSLREQLVQYDFAAVRAALIASVPSRMPDWSTVQVDPKGLWDQQLWGYPSLFRSLESICPTAHPKAKGSHPSYIDKHEDANPHVICQVSSIATLPVPWLNQFFPALCGQHSRDKPKPTTTTTTTTPSAKQTQTQTQTQAWTNNISIIYPTPANVAVSLDGYASGGSIHTKAQTAAHLKQIATLRKSLCQWTEGPNPETRAGRHLAAPHIKTYVRFRAKPTTEHPAPDIDWALMTSANLSTQAWGTLREKGKEKGKNKDKDGGKEKEKEVVVQSFEIGVLVWPELYDDGFNDDEKEEEEDKEDMRPLLNNVEFDSGETRAGDGLKMPGRGIHGTNTPPPTSTSSTSTSTVTTKRRKNHKVRMVPVFGTDTPSRSGPSSSSSQSHQDGSGDQTQSTTSTTLVGLRLPYDLPLTPYTDDDMPWSPQGVYNMPDRHGRRWPRDFY